MINVVSLKKFDEFDETSWTAIFVLLIFEQLAIAKTLHFNVEHSDKNVERIKIFCKVY
jgi:hypothetical protein